MNTNQPLAYTNSITLPARMNNISTSNLL